ncbi:MAG: dUTP diphosphatase [Clostridiales bacterium]|nr:dUTP diphosphatase [Clostridiales bacterium]
MREKVKIYIEKCRDTAIIPAYANCDDAGMDICAAEDIIINPGETVIVPTGLKVAIPEGFEIQVRPRSGISLRTKLRLSNSPGTIDSGYRNEVGIIMTNVSNSETALKLRTLEKDNGGQGTYKIKKGDRIAQFVLARVPLIEFEETDSVKNIGSNRGGGFGSTGHK